MSAGHSDTFHHIRDSRVFELPQFLGGNTPTLPDILPGHPLTKFMVLELVAMLLTLFIFVGLARHIRKGSPARGRFWNLWEAMALFIRDNVVRSAIGEGHHHEEHDGHEEHHGHDAHGGDHHGHAGHHHEPQVGALKSTDFGVTRVSHPADKFVPFVLTVFFFILFCNLLGAIPWLGSPTGQISVTGMLALAVFLRVLTAGSAESGVAGFWKTLVPKMDLPGPMGLLIIPMIWLIEVMGLLVKHGVLAVRLFANIMAGHTVIAVLLSFIGLVGAMNNNLLFGLVAPASILGQVFVGMIELFVAFLQAYIFAYLASLFIGVAVHPH